MTAHSRSLRSGAALCCAAAFLLLQSPGASAQVEPPNALEQPELDTPTGRDGTPIEGWAIVRFTVGTDGRTTDARIVDKLPASLAERDIERAVEAWTFEPATADGEPIDWFNNEAAIVFDAEDVPPEPPPAFIAAYGEAAGLLEAGQYADALRSNDRLLQMPGMRLRELALAHVQRAAIGIALGDNHEAYAAILRATDPLVPALDPEQLSIALQYRNALELQLGDAGAVLETFRRRRALGPVPVDDPVGSRIDAIEQVLADQESVIVVTAKVLDEQWRHVPARRTFAIANIDGSIGTIHVECDRRTADLEYMPDSEWTLPESWGRCMLAIDGRRDTTFRFFEFL